jgi:prepilin-type processing-associated H-X9-DG protein
LWWTEHEIPRTPGNEAAVARECETGRTSQWPSEFWGVDSPGHGYDHRLPPNRPACWNGDYLHAYTSDATVPASSNHGPSVNVLFIDGHASTISDGIDLSVWQAIGTINGGDSVGEF